MSSSSFSCKSIITITQVVVTLQHLSLLSVCLDEKWRKTIKAVSWIEGLLMRCTSSQLSFYLSGSNCAIISLKTKETGKRLKDGHCINMSAVPQATPTNLLLTGSFIICLINLISLVNYLSVTATWWDYEAIMRTVHLSLKTSTCCMFLIRLKMPKINSDTLACSLTFQSHATLNFEIKRYQASHLSI